MKLGFALLLTLVMSSTYLLAEEGMWLPVLIENQTIDVMHENGFKLSAEDIYSVNKSCMKDGILIFGGGCTGEIISNKGLVLTNHHCGFRYIQRHSSLNNDYITNGFWAMNQNEELSNPGLTATFLKYMKDVTSEVLKGVTDDMSISVRNEIISNNSDTLIKNALKNTHFIADINTFYEGNQYFLFVSEVFTDVRLVGAPPTSVGSFGGDIDNWMWPRHGGDFSLFRIYADSSNLPKTYSDDNVPYKPNYVFPISTKGVKEGDFTMVFGYPGSTQQYRTSHHLTMLTKALYPELIEIRNRKLEVIDHHMNTNAERRIKYAAKAASISNSWKRWRGEIKGLERFDVITQKQNFEKVFNIWAQNNTQYANLLSEYETLYNDYSVLNVKKSILRELFGSNSMECYAKANSIFNKLTIAEKQNNSASIDELRGLYKDFDIVVDKDLSNILLAYLFNTGYTDIIPSDLKSLHKRTKGNIKTLNHKLYKKSIVKDSTWIKDYANGKKDVLKRISKDPFFKIHKEYENIYYSILSPQFNLVQAKLDSLDMLYMKAIMDFDTTTHFYPDANFTLRITHGKVKGYEPLDGVTYKYYTTTDGILQKYNPKIYDYNIPDKLLALIRNKDFGAYAHEGEMPVCFVATNHTTGGNSGSPVFNAEGHLIGLNFDRAWDGVMSDLYYNPEICRNISVDIRYILFIIDKFAGANYLLNEMEIVQ